MGVLSIKIRIGDREYPMKVDEREEELLRNAGRLLNEKLRTFKESYQIDDKQDLMAMVAFDGMVQNLKLSQENILRSWKNKSQKQIFLNEFKNCPL